MGDHHEACGCAGGTCECDLYPDYSEHRSHGVGSSASGTSRDDSGGDADEREVVPPLRALQFFNSNFGSTWPPKSPRHAKRGRALKERKSSPSLRVLCYCRCPASGVPIG